MKDARLKKGLTQNDVAQKVNISTRAYQYFEKGTIQPKLKTALKIAKVLNTTVEELFPLHNKQLKNNKHLNNNTKGE